jgi:hypothetical protein
MHDGLGVGITISNPTDGNGTFEVVRVSGPAQIAAADDLLEAMAVQGKRN